MAGNRGVCEAHTARGGERESAGPVGIRRGTVEGWIACAVGLVSSVLNPKRK
jgi:hypothetical protein